jgi:hypothetical protein
MLIRAILDHIPPLFVGSVSFEQVVENYPWSASEKKFMQGLLDFKNEADDSLHNQISNRKDYMSMNVLPADNRFNRLIQEATISQRVDPNILTKRRIPTQSNKDGSKVEIEFLKNHDFTWANYAVGKRLWSSFRFVLKVDNYKSSIPDYVRVRVAAKGNDGRVDFKHFQFERAKGGLEMDLNEPFKISERDIKTLSVFVSDTDSEEKRPMLDIDKDTVEVVVNTRSGKEFRFPVPTSVIRTG